MAEDLPTVELAKDRAGQGEVTAQGRMVRVVDQVVANQSIGADCNQLATAVDQDAAWVPFRDLFNGLAKSSLATERQSVVIERGQVMVARLLGFGPAVPKHPSQPEMASAKPGAVRRIA